MGDVVPIGLPEFTVGYHLGRLRLLTESAPTDFEAFRVALVAEVDALDVAVHGLLAVIDSE